MWNTRRDELAGRTAIFIEDYSSMGGVEKVTSNLIALFKLNGIAIDALVSLYKKNTKPFIRFEDELEVTLLDKQNDSESDPKSLLLRFIKDNGIKNLIVQIQDLKTGAWVAETGREAAINVICILHSSPFYFLKNIVHDTNKIRHFLRVLKRKVIWYPYNVSLFKKIIADANYFVCISNKAAVELKSVQKLDSKKIITIYNPLNSFSKSDNPVSRKKGHTLIFAGRLSFEKQVVKILEAWHALYPRFRQWSFYILGDGPERANIECYIKEKQIQGVHLEGIVNNVEQYLEKSRICVLFSLTEGLPTILLEAAAHGNALVGNNSFGGTADIIIDGSNGFLIQNSDVTELKEKLGILMGDDALTEKMARQGLEHLHKFDNKQIAQKWKEILK